MVLSRIVVVVVVAVEEVLVDPHNDATAILANPTLADTITTTIIVDTQMMMMTKVPVMAVVVVAVPVTMMVDGLPLENPTSKVVVAVAPTVVVETPTQPKAPPLKKEAVRTIDRWTANTIPMNPPQQFIPQLFQQHLAARFDPDYRLTRVGVRNSRINGGSCIIVLSSLATRMC